ncbi:MAG TPA: hypothetical protein VKZ67_14720 [Natronosporangium sp.]|nr:hypothetical protein [Natronosporangium sp.]
MAVDVYAALKELIQRILGDRDTAAQYAADPYGTLTAQGITDGDVSQVNIPELAGSCATEAGLPPHVQQSLQNYPSSGGSATGPVPPPASSHPQTPQDVVQHLNYITYQTYEGDEYITQQLINQEVYDYSTHIDNSVDVNVDGDIDGDLELDVTNVNATGDGAVAAGDDITNAATGGGVVVDGDNHGQVNTGDGAVLAGRDIEAPVNTGEFTGVQADGDVSDTVVGDGNQTVNVDGDADSGTFNFGDGDVTNFGNAEFDNSAVSVGGGDVSNVADNLVEDGSALAVGGDATTSYEESYEETSVEAHHSQVATEQGYGDLEQRSDLEIEVEVEVENEYGAHGNGI